MNAQYIVILISLLVLNACGPVYEIQYVYKPPQNDFGVKCIKNCANQKIFCKNEANKDLSICKMHEDSIGLEKYNDYFQDVISRGVTPHSDTNKKTFTNYSICESKYEASNCSQEFRNCYLVCEGQIETKAVCVGNCDKTDIVDTI
ncbi:MAG: hypothetical protein HOI53_00630 [Francisellaceae bacterium]|nr:hypothetical protein [Francisellaceae bacterium]MBT6206505.1 hypothetical protein [Francisellaceae bacterium]MBT6539713.1 hypothetical protein [Francisellaceae bacterium]